MFCITFGIAFIIAYFTGSLNKDPKCSNIINEKDCNAFKGICHWLKSTTQSGDLRSTDGGKCKSINDKQ